jgi:hypothetical protein
MNRKYLRRLRRNLNRWTSIPYLKSLKRRIGTLETVVEILLSNVDILLANTMYEPDPSTALNGQVGRQRIFKEIVGRARFNRIVETGTFIGNTAGWMNHVTGLPVHSSEINRHFHMIARKRLASCKDIDLEVGDSVDILCKLADSPLAGERIFFYLDAHWYESLPLADELRLIARHWRDFVVMIDDFEVPGDDGYRFDDYGFRRSLTIGCFGKVFRELELLAYSPALPSAQETGARSGCVVLAKKGSNAVKELDAISLLKSTGIH